MVKKKKEVLIEAPVTLEEYRAFVETWKRLKAVLTHLDGPATSSVDTKYHFPTHNYKYAQGYNDIEEQGVWFYHVEQDQYDEGYSAHTYLIPIEAILHPQVWIDKFNADRAEVEKMRKRSEQENERVTYERLRVKFEGKS